MKLFQRHTGIIITEGYDALPDSSGCPPEH